MNRLVFACAVLVAVSVSVLNATNCSSTCEEYSICTSLKNQTNMTAFLSNSMVCSSDNDVKLGLLFGRLDECKLKEAAIEVADLTGISWDGVSAIEALMSDQDFWMAECEWEHLAAAACVYFSLPDDTTCTNPAVKKSDMFCKNECMQIASKCLNLQKYKQLNESVTSFCADLTVTDDTDSCYKAQIDQPGLHLPTCTVVTSVSLLGPYIVGGVGLALAVVAILGLVLMNVKKGEAGVPNSY